MASYPAAQLLFVGFRLRVCLIYISRATDGRLSTEEMSIRTLVLLQKQLTKNKEQLPSSVTDEHYIKVAFVISQIHLVYQR